MAFSNNEKINHSTKLSLQISGSADDSPSQKQWYAEENSFNFIVPPDFLWNQISLVPGASTQSEADAAVILQPTILESKKIRLTVDPASNNRSYEARFTFGDRTSDIVGNWIQPSLIRNNGGPSQGYIIRLFAGDPDGMSYVELPTSFHSGSDGSCSWQWNYASGILLVSTDEMGTYGGLYLSDGLYVKGYCYVGTTGGGASSGGTLNQAYNYGGAGSGRSITVLPKKPVEFNASGECSVYADGYFTLNTIAEPLPRANKGNLYSSNPGSGTSELFYMDNNGATTQITEDGYLATANSLTRVGLYAHPNDPHMNPGEGFLYAKPISSGLELFFMDGNGRAIQITKNGKLAR